MLAVPFDDQQKDAGRLCEAQEGRKEGDIWRFLVSTRSAEETQRSVCVLKRDILWKMEKERRHRNGESTGAKRA